MLIKPLGDAALRSVGKPSSPGYYMQHHIPELLGNIARAENQEGYRSLGLCRRVVRQLIRLLKAEDRELARAAARALSEINAVEAIPHLRKTKHSSRDIRDAIDHLESYKKRYGNPYGWWNWI
jgi:sirohydrochlorin ferrochelatase